MDAAYRLLPGLPSPETYVRLRREAGLSPKSLAAAQRGLPRSLAGVTVEHDASTIAMGRIIGDGSLFAQIVDIAVEPDHQGRGIGKAIMEALMTWLRLHAPGAYVSLIADGNASQLYAQYGFKPTTPRSIGMAMIIPETE